MNVFLSWSGVRSRTVAEALGEWLPGIHRGWRPWVSSRQKRGTDWRAALFEHVNAADAAVLCLTSDSIESRWLAFEAGMLSRTANACLVVYGLDIEADELSATPFAGMPVFSATEEGTRQLVRMLNAALPQPEVGDDLEAIVSAAWPRLEHHLGNVPALETRPFRMFVMIPRGVAQYDFEIPNDCRWAGILAFVSRALSEQHGVPNTDLSKVDYFDLDEKRWIEAPRRLSGVKTTRLVAVHPDTMEKFGSKGSAEITIAFQLDQHPREARADALIRRDLRDLAREQATHREKHGVYARQLEELEFITATDVSIEIIEATQAGWCAVGAHKDLRWRLGIRYGTTERFADKAAETMFPV